jgi:glc operon protein GlcG
MNRSLHCLMVLLLTISTISAAAQSPTAIVEALPGQNGTSPPYGMPITLSQAERVLATAKAEAKRLETNDIAIAVVGPNGELIAFAKLDDATIHSINYAQQKAQAAARSRRITATPPLDMAAALISMPDFVAMPGGVPIVVAGKTIGAVGISGGPNGGDQRIAVTASKALQ